MVKKGSNQDGLQKSRDILNDKTRSRLNIAKPRGEKKNLLGRSWLGRNNANQLWDFQTTNYPTISAMERKRKKRVALNPTDQVTRREFIEKG